MKGAFTENTRLCWQGEKGGLCGRLEGHLSGSWNVGAGGHVGGN